jgi:hypothetical protein
MAEPMRPSIHEVEAAARVLFKEGQFHHWWPEFAKPYDDLLQLIQSARPSLTGLWNAF